MFDQVWHQLTETILKQRLPHALLFIGDQDVLIKQFAKRFANALFCRDFQLSGQACGHCQSCYLAEKESHPDLLWVESEPGHAIKIDPVREVTEFVNQTALLGGYRIIIIHPADAMNINAANALLKTLEEPSKDTLFILISQQSASLPMTILSRCQKIFFKSNENEQVSTAESNPLALEFQQGLLQLSLRQTDPITLASRWYEEAPETLLTVLFYWVKAVLRAKIMPDSSMYANASEKYSAVELINYLDHLQAVTRFIREGFNLNKRLFLEELLIKWVPNANRAG